MNEPKNDRGQPDNEAQAPASAPGDRQHEPAVREAEPTAAEAAHSEPVTLSRAEYEELKTLACERDDYLKRLQRAVADYQNFRNRVENSTERLRQMTIRTVAEEILPVADSLARALEAAEKTEGAANIVEGLRLVEKEFYGALSKLGVRPVEAVGQKFDPHYHEAAMQEPAEGVPPNTVVRELKKGFVLGDQVIRPSQVSVAAPDPHAQAPGEQGGDAEGRRDSKQDG